MKAQNFAAVGTGAFRKEQDGDTLAKDVDHLLCDFVGAGAALAIDEDGAAAAREESKDRPVAYFAFGDEDAGHGRGEDRDIEITEVVGDDESLRGAMAAALDFYSEIAKKQRAGPMEPLGALT